MQCYANSFLHAIYLSLMITAKTKDYCSLGNISYVYILYIFKTVICYLSSKYIKWVQNWISRVTNYIF